MYLKNFGKAKTIFKERSFKEDGASSSWKEMFKEEELARRERKRREEEGRRRPDLQPPPLFPFPDPSNPLQVEPPPQGFPGAYLALQHALHNPAFVVTILQMLEIGTNLSFEGILGGDYDRFPGGQLSNFQRKHR